MARDLERDSDASMHTRLNDENAYTRPKKLIVCCDGTWMDSDNGYVQGSWGSRGHLQTPSNVTRIARAISSEDDAHHPQIVYYQAGIGTGIGLASHLLGGGTGLGLEENIREAYAFIANNYRPQDQIKSLGPDKIFLVGFSRGAYTARSIGGLVGAIGVLRKRAMPHFYEIFSDWSHAGQPDYTPLFFDSWLSQHTKDNKVELPSLKLAHDKDQVDVYLGKYRTALLALSLTQEVKINCIGVWDTVGALGVPITPFLQRALPFMPSFVRDYRWFDTRLDNNITYAFQALALNERRYPFSPTLWESGPTSTTQLKQVWFPGSHSNVGGSYEDTGIADITLAWMMDQLAGHTVEHKNNFDPVEWIKFDENHIYERSDFARDPYEKSPGAYKGWAMGKLYNSCYFPMALLGATTRIPGRYHSTNFETGKPEKRLLEGTEERIHSSVRARIDLGGRGVEPDWKQIFPNGVSIWPLIKHYINKLLRREPQPYQPHLRGGPLYGWKLEDGHKSHEGPNWEFDVTHQITWKYEGKDRSGVTVMQEDKLGPFELKLLEDRQKSANKTMVLNDSRKWVVAEESRGPRRGHTF